MTRIVFALTLALSSQALAGSKATSTHTATSAHGVTVGVSGMTCQGCKEKVQSELEKLKSEAKYQGKIKEIVVDLKKKTATVQMIETVNMSADEQAQLKKEIAEAITRADYEPVLEPSPLKKNHG